MVALVIVGAARMVKVAQTQESGRCAAIRIKSSNKIHKIIWRHYETRL